MIDPVVVARWMKHHGEIWQADLLSHEELASFAAERDVRFRAEHIALLWQVGLLRADLIRATRKLRGQGFVHVGTDDEGRDLYADARPYRRRRAGWIDIGVGRRQLPPSVDLLFHPFRFYVLSHLQRQLETGIDPMQLLIGADNAHKVLDRVIEVRRRVWSAKANPEAVRRWNATVALVVAIEPCVYERLYGTFRWPWYMDEHTQRQLVAEQARDLADELRHIGVEELTRIHTTLCIHTALLDRNQSVQLLLRLSTGERRTRLRGHLGGALTVRAMAEALRRMTEDVFGVQLPEEDEIGHGQWDPGVREMLYGTARVIDGGRAARREVLRGWGLDQSVRTRWYVEGRTELGAIRSAVGGDYLTGIEVVDLHGQVVQRGGRGIAFRESLNADERAGVFSVISIDGDVSDNLRVVRQAARDDVFCGLFFISQPDFEFASFTLDELEAVLWELATEHGAGDRERLHAALAGTTTAKELMQRAQRTLPSLVQATKGEGWGEALIRYGLAHPEYADGTVRPVVHAVRTVMRGSGANFRWTRLHNRTDPETGQLVPRDPDLRRWESGP